MCGSHGRVFLVGQPVDGREDRLASDRVGVDGQRLFRFLGRFRVIVVFERQPRQQFLRLHQLGIGLQRFVRQVRRPVLVGVGGHQRQPEQGLRVVLLELQCLVEQVGGVVLLILLQHHAAVARLDVGVVREFRFQCLEDFVGVDVAPRLPQRLRLLQRLRRSRTNKQQPGSAEPQDAFLGSLVERLLKFGEFEEQRRQLLFVLGGVHGRLLILQLIDGVLDLLFLVEQRALVGIPRRRRIGAESHHGKRGGKLSLAVLRLRVPLAFALARVFQHRVLGGQPLLRVEEFGGLALRVVERLERRDRFVLVRVRRRDRAGPPPRTARNTVAFFSEPAFVAVITTRFGRRRNSIDPPLELVVTTTNCRDAGT